MRVCDTILLLMAMLCDGGGACLECWQRLPVEHMSGEQGVTEL